MEAVNNEVDKVIWDSEKLDILALFEDICPQFLEEIGEQHGFMRDAVITAILDRQDQGKPYPKRAKSRKRKRDDNEVEDAESHSATVAAKIESPAYGLRLRSATYRDFATLLITQDFPMIPKPTVRRKLLGENRHSLFKTYSFIDNAMRRRNGLDPGLPWQNKRVPTKSLEEYSPANIANLNMEALCENQRAALDEFVAARAVRQQKDEKQAAEAAELANLEQAKLKGETAECGCCFDEYPLNRMVHCEGETTHWFCRTCMTEQAKTTIGYFKYELSCVSIDGCQAGFSASQKRNFLDDNLQLALDRIEQQAMLEQAGIENLEACPFCPFAMEYPPMRENKEFRCANPGCEIVSCRLCRKETHVPKSCAEAAAEESSRHVVEEAMSEALIRKCNKCANPYIKLHHSCNKVTCTRCGTIQCYVCRKTVKDYSHFNDVNRGGKHGQCPLFDNTDERHEREVRSAEENSKPQANQNNIQPVINTPSFQLILLRYGDLRGTQLT
ncbi:hypothetical protein BX600DRAFT_25593 [Xylariales sp. PMI_506]|nr:hypothetical protein BX600DRAFT_25593 [Xylariales sp. PMI_506]